MRIVFLTADVLHHIWLINKVHEKFPVEKVWFQRAHLEQGTVSALFFRYLKSGRLDLFFRRVFSKLLFFRDRQNEREFERSYFFKDGPAQLAKDLSVQIMTSFNDPESISALKKLNPDVVIVCGTEILKPEVLRVAKKGTINIHRAILPQYRGGGLPEWNFYHRDFENLGCTVHFCAEKLDAGAIVAQRFYKIGSNDTIWQHRTFTTVLALECLLEALQKFSTDSVVSSVQGNGKTWRARDLTLWKQIVARHNFYAHTKQLRKLADTRR